MHRAHPPVTASVLFALASSTLGSAQVTFRAVTRTGLFATAGPTQSIPPQTDITNGTRVASFGSGPTGSASAATSFSVTRSDRALEIVLDEDGTATFNPQGGFIFPAAQVGEPFAIPPYHAIDIELSSAVPMTVRLALTTCSEGLGYAGYEGVLSIPGHGFVTNSSTQRVSCFAPVSATYDLTLGPTPTVLVLATMGRCQSSRVINYARFRGRWTLTITNPSTCNGTGYDPPCGADLTSYGTLDLPGTWIDLVDSTPPMAALLLVGTQRQRLPFGPCLLYTDFPVILPFGLTGTHRARVYVPPPPVPVQVTAQGVTIGAAGLHASNGLELRCR